MDYFNEDIVTEFRRLHLKKVIPVNFAQYLKIDDKKTSDIVNKITNYNWIPGTSFSYTKRTRKSRWRYEPSLINEALMQNH